MERPRLEVALAITIVLVTAVFIRDLWVPAVAERHLEEAERKYDLELGEPNRWFSSWTIGDGQAFAVIAADPTGMKLSREVKEPVYRFSRAGYGWLSYVASTGQERWVPFGLGLVGGLAVIGNLVLAIHLRSRLGPRVWVLMANPVLYMGFAGDTAEPLALFFLTIAIAFGGSWAAVALGVTRPSYLLGLSRRPRALVVGVLSATLLLVYSIVRFGTDGLISGAGRIGIPFAAYFENPSIAGWVLALAATVTLLMGVRGRDWSWILSGLLVISLGSDVTRVIENAWRASGMLPVLWVFGLRYSIPREASDASPAVAVWGSV